MTFRLTQAAEYLGILRRHLQSMIYSGKISSSFKTSGGHHRFRKTDLDQYLGIKNEVINQTVAVYARVSTGSQSDDLLRQKNHLIDYCNKFNLTPYVLIEDIASRLNETRKGLNKILSLAKDQKISKVIISYKERLARFGYRYIETYLSSYGVNIIVVDQTELKGDNEELVDDVLAILTSFSARIYGHRSHKYSQLKKVVNELNEND